MQKELGKDISDRGESKLKDLNGGRMDWEFGISRCKLYKHQGPTV